MTVLYSNNFDSEATGALTGWTTWGITGGQVVQLFSSAGVTPISGTKGFGQSSDADAATWNGGTGLGNQAVRTAMRVNSMADLRTNAPILRASPGHAYVFGIVSNGTALKATIYKYDNGFSLLAESSFSIAATTGDLIHIEVSAIGSALSSRVWINGNARPSSATVSATDGTFATGAPGLRKGGSFGLALCDDLVITDGAGGEDFFYAPSPSITTQPSNQSVVAGATATFNVAATASGGSLSYQWQRSTDSGSTWNSVATGTGGTTNAYTTAATTVTGGNANNGDRYRVLVTDSNGTTTSSSATLTVTSGPTGPTINTQPTSQAVTAPATATFTASLTASGGSVTYQWQRSTNSGSTWNNVTTGTGGTTNSYTTAATTVSGGNANNGDRYRLQGTDSNGTTTTNSVTLTVNAAVTGPTINTQPAAQTVTTPNTATFSVAATASAGSLTYQWQRSTDSGSTWNSVSGGSGGTTNSYTTPATAVTGGSANNGDRYRVQVTDSNGTTTSNGVTLTVNGTGPSFTTQPSNQTVTAGSTATFTAAATASSGSVTWQWQRSTNGGSSWANVSGATSASYTTPATTTTGGSANNGDQYRATATDSNGSVNSNAVTLTVNAAGGGGATFVINRLFNDPDTTLADTTDWTVNVYNPTTGVLVAQVTGVSINSSGAMTITHANLVSGTSYAFEPVHATHGRLLPVGTAS
jgi:hypothetical protein